MPAVVRQLLPVSALNPSGFAVAGNRFNNANNNASRWRALA